MDRTISDIFEEMQKLHKNNALHRDGFRAGELSPSQISHRVTLSSQELENAPGELDKMADVLIGTLGAAVTSGYTSENLRAATLRKIREQFPTSYSNEAETVMATQQTKGTPQEPRRIREFAVIASVAVLLFAIITAVTQIHAVDTNVLAAGRKAVMHTVACTFPTRATYHGVKSTLSAVAIEYGRAADRSETCAREATTTETRAEFLLAAADSLSSESVLETNFDKRKASRTWSRAIRLADETRATTKRKETRIEAEEILKQLKAEPTKR